MLLDGSETPLANYGSSGTELSWSVTRDDNYSGYVCHAETGIERDRGAHRGVE
jgi:hypothetical protein